MFKFVLSFLLFSISAFGQMTKEEAEYITKTFYPATVLLYAQDDDGSMRMRCTATAIEKIPKGYVFVTASHCACTDDTEKELAVPDSTFFFVTDDAEDTKEFIRATLMGCGYQHKSDDIALFSVETTTPYPIVAIGKNPATMDSVFNVASPLGLGKQVFQGSVTAAFVNRPIVQGDINWTKATLIQIPGTDGGSSGSSIVCANQRAICAFLVGQIRGTTMVAMPVSRLTAFRKKLDEKSYKYWRDDAEPEVRYSNIPRGPKK